MDNSFKQNGNFIIKIVLIVQRIRALLHILLYISSPSKHIIEKDLERWSVLLKINENMTHIKALIWMLWRYPEYRNLFYYRIKKDYRLFSTFLAEVAKLFFSPMQGLFLRADEIGEGFFIQHGYATGISAKKIGKNCWVNQQVVVGYSNDNHAPTIGDNVHITAGAKVFGNVHIGDNCIIGANAVVVKNIPPNCTVVGVPAYIIKRDGQKVNKEPL